MRADLARVVAGMSPKTRGERLAGPELAKVVDQLVSLTQVELDHLSRALLNDIYFGRDRRQTAMSILRDVNGLLKWSDLPAAIERVLGKTEGPPRASLDGAATVTAKMIEKERRTGTRIEPRDTLEMEDELSRLAPQQLEELILTSGVDGGYNNETIRGRSRAFIDDLVAKRGLSDLARAITQLRASENATGFSGESTFERR